MKWACIFACIGYSLNDGHEEKEKDKHSWEGLGEKESPLWTLTHTLKSLISTSLISLLFLCPQTLGNSCSQFKSHSLSHFPPIFHGF